MTETTLRVDHEMVLSDDLKYTKFNTDNVKNHVEINTLEKAFTKTSASSLDSSSITWNLPSISGGAVVRNLTVEVPIQFQITFQGIIPVGHTLAGPAVANGASLLILGNGSSPRPFMTEINCLDQFPLSKIFGTREYTINNSSTVLKEDFSPNQIDAMVAGGDLRKMRNAGLEPFSDANSHFRTLAHTWGGTLPPTLASNGTVAGTVEAGFNWAALAALFEAAIPSSGGVVSHYLSAPWSRSARDDCETWASKRNRARNIVSSTVSASTGTLGVVPSCGQNLVLIFNGAQAADSAGRNTAVYPNANVVYTFTIIVREQLWSQFFDNEYAFNKFQWNKLLPASSLNIKFGFNQQYLNEAVLKIGDYVSDIIAGAGTTYSVSAPTIPTNLQSSCVLYLQQCKIPLALLPRQSYKVLYYAQDKPQGRKRSNFVASTKTLTATMQYANLSQIPEYLMQSLVIDKASFLAAISANGETNSIAYQLPSTFNLPITDLVMTFNQDTGLATHGLDMYQFQQYTMENLQNNEELEDLIVGCGKCGVDAEPSDRNILNTGVATTTPEQVAQYALQGLSTVYGYGLSNKVNYNGISNSSFYLLKLGSQIRLPDGISPNMIVNYNLEIQATCDLTKLKRAYGDTRSDVDWLLALATSNANAFENIKADLEVIHFNKRIFTLSGDALQNIYVHNVQMTSAEYLELRNSFMAEFNKLSKEDIFDTRMMIGGGFFSRLKDKAVSALNWLKPRVDDALKTGRTAIDFAKSAVGDSSLRKYVDMADEGLSSVGYGRGGSAHELMAEGRGGSAHELMAEGRRRAPRAKKSAAADWQKYLQHMKP